MLVIRRKQFEALAEMRLSKFETRMVEHLTEAFPDWSKAQGQQKLAEFVHYGVNRAFQYDIRIELQVARYLHVMQAMGADFDTSGKYPWVQPLLQRSDLDPGEKVARLKDAAEYHVEEQRIRNLVNDPGGRSHAR
jgi:hypothetical protein